MSSTKTKGEIRSHDQRPPDPAVVRRTCNSYLALLNVAKSFGSTQVLDKVSLGVKRGETLCIMGRSGVGKSVCLRLMMGFLKTDQGRVIAAGEDVTDYSEVELERIHRKVTMVFQNGALFDSLTVRENVAFPLRERDGIDEEQISRRADDLLEMVGARHAADFLPANISTGLKRSVAIARALAANPEAVLYDEPTTMVDPLMARRLGSLIAELKVRLSLTSIVVTHDTRLATKVADQVVFLDDAKVVFSGRPEDMQHSSVPIVQEFLEFDRVDLGNAESRERLAA